MIATANIRGRPTISPIEASAISKNSVERLGLAAS